MSLHVECVPRGEVSEPELRRMAGDSWFASAAFASLWRAKGGEPVAWIVERGGRLAGVMPGIEYGHGPFARFCSMPDGCYGGLHLDPALEPQRPAVARALFDALGVRRYRCAQIFDFYGTIPEHDGFARLPCEATMIAIDRPDWSPPDRKLIAQARKATREGIRVERFEWTRHGDGFLRLVRLTARRHHREPRYPPAFYQALAVLAESDPRIEWRWCEHDGAPAASHIYVRERGMLLAWHSYFDRRFSWLKPNPYIRLAMARAAAPEGVGCLNLGSTPEGAGGLAAYKRRWGGAARTYASFEQQRPVHAGPLLSLLAWWRDAPPPR